MDSSRGGLFNGVFHFTNGQGVYERQRVQNRRCVEDMPILYSLPFVNPLSVCEMEYAIE
jgi:hypothetical protein